MEMEDTIAAIATPPGEGGIGIIRMSGRDAVGILKRIFKSKRNIKVEDMEPRKSYYGHIVKPGAGEGVVDEVLVIIMKAPYSYTKEDVVEISCHGGIIPVKEILSLLLDNGARLAEPGEFTKRAFLNGRIDLAQAEAVMDIISSKTDIAHRASLRQLEGVLSKEINAIKDKLLGLAAHIEAMVDYPEDEIDSLEVDDIRGSMEKVIKKIEHLVETSESGRIIREGLTTAIIGKPNVGKSSLLNAMVRENRAIVTEIPGTTRDVIEEYINIKGILLRLVDTAGIRETEDLIEKIGVDKSRKIVKDADLVIMMFDAAQEISDEDREIIRIIEDKRVIVLINKSDLTPKIDEKEIMEIFRQTPIIKISVKEGKGLDQLENAIVDMVYEGRVSTENQLLVTNIRHIDALKRSKKCLWDGLDAINQGMPIDLISIDIRNALKQLGEITGDTVDDDIIDRIFSAFCVGK
jgi:tRNA modification GTPase